MRDPRGARRARLLGVDTGGTYTDAAVFDDATGAVLGKAKALTTPRDLAVGVGGAVAAALDAAGVPAASIQMASLSTTLATNALVEGHGDAAGLILIGFREADFAQPCAGGHDGMGGQAAALDENALRQGVRRAAGSVQAFAVAGVFAVRNPAHEIAARRIVAEETGLPVSCSHELSAKLGGPKRALTALLNGRLIGMIDRLIEGTERRLGELGVNAPLMVVRGDGALMSAATARQRPIETILSGPAASVVGAAALTGAGSAVVSDIGGTTTDIAVLEGGRPRIDPEGAKVGGWRTMVEAVAMRTHGLGGDSEVGVDQTALSPRLTLGPKRAIPVSLYAMERPEAHEALDRQLDAARVGEDDGVFVTPGARSGDGLAGTEAAIMARVAAGAALDQLGLGRRDQAALTRLIAGGWLRRVAFTPTDAAHVLGLHDGFDRAAAEKAARLFAARKGNDGRVLAETAEALASRVIAHLRRRSAELALDAAYEADGFGAPQPGAAPIAARALDRAGSLVETRIRLTAPLIGLGASAPTYYPEVAALLDAEAAIPEHADVANAVGAVAGRVEMKAEAVLQQTEDEGFVVTLAGAPERAASEEAAFALAEARAGAEATERAKAAGAEAPELRFDREERRATIEGRSRLVEARVIAIAAGRPGFARDAT